MFLLTVTYLYTELFYTFLFIMNENENFLCFSVLYFSMESVINIFCHCASLERILQLLTTQSLGCAIAFLPKTERSVEIKDMLYAADSAYFSSSTQASFKGVVVESKFTALKTNKDGPECIFSMLF